MTDFPNVPDVPGVPALPRNPLDQVPPPSLLTADGGGFFASSGSPEWGIFFNGQNVVAADSVVSFDYKQSWSVADYPVEEGAFESYDKVQTPFNVRVRMATGGSEEDRQAFLDSVAAIAGTLDLYDVVTPEVVYQSVNVMHYDYRRTSTNGVGLIVVDIWLLEVRVTATAAFSNTKTPSGAGQVNGGTVQPIAPTGAQSGSLSGIQ